MTPSKDMLEQSKTFISIAVPVIACLFFFFTTNAGVDANATRIQENKAAIEKLEARMESMSTMLQENNTNIKLLQKDLEYLIESMKDG